MQSFNRFSRSVLLLNFVADVNVAIRKIATLLKPDKDIVHDGDHIIIKTLSTFKNYNMDFYVGKEFEEDLSGVDDRKCMVSIWRKVFREKCTKQKILENVLHHKLY